MKPAIIAILLALLSACGDGGCDWPQVPEKPTHVPQGSED